MTGPTFQELIQRLNAYWAERGCVLIQPLDLEVGAGTFHPATFLRSIHRVYASGDLPIRAAIRLRERTRSPLARQSAP